MRKGFAFSLIVIIALCFVIGCNSTPSVSTLTEIFVSTNPTKVAYHVGDSLDLTGMVVEAKYSDGTSKAITGYTTDPANGTKLESTGVKNITVSYEGKNCSFNITVFGEEDYILSVTTNPTKITYNVGDKLDLSGMVVEAVYPDGTKKVITDYTTVPANGSKLEIEGKQEVVVSYNTLSDSFVVTVVSKPSYIDFETFLKNVNNSRKYYSIEDLEKLDVDKYIPDFYDSLDDVSKEEAESMMNEHPAYNFTKEGVIEDIDLFFRTIRAYYGSYEYFGGDEVFSEAKEKIIREINDSNFVFTNENCVLTVIKNLSFMKDGHAQFGNHELIDVNNQLFYDYYLKDYFFTRNSRGEFISQSGSKVKSILGQDSVSEYMKPSIDEEGNLCYIILINALPDDKRLTNSKLVFEDSGKERELTFSWTKFTKRKITRDQYYQECKTYDGLTLVAVRDSGESPEHEIEVPLKLSEIGQKTVSEPLIMYDVITSYDWDRLIKPKGFIAGRSFDNFKASNVAEYIGRTQIMPREITKGEYYQRIFSDIPVEDKSIKFFIQDQNNGSGLETMLIGFRTLSNTLFVGGRSIGLQITGGNYGFFLPNTGWNFQIGMNMQFDNGSTDCIDGYGYEPDLWVDPIYAQERITKLCKKYNLN